MEEKKKIYKINTGNENRIIDKEEAIGILKFYEENEMKITWVNVVMLLMYYLANKNMVVRRKHMIKYINLIENLVDCKGKTPRQTLSATIYYLIKIGFVEKIPTGEPGKYVRGQYKLVYPVLLEKYLTDNSSKGEKKITITLEELQNIYNFKFKPQKTKKIYNKYYYFDFEIRINNKIIFVEYDGAQHYKPVVIFGGFQGYLRTRKNDIIKNCYCKRKNIPLYRISYTSFNNIESILNTIIVNNIKNISTTKIINYY